MAYVKLDKEYASAIKNALTDINEEISLTLSSVSSSFYNKKISLSSSFLKKYDEEGELIVNYTGNAINYNTAADNGGDRAATLSSTISAKVKKVTNAIEKVLSLVETFEGQTGLSIEAEVGSDLSSAFQFLSQYGDASALSALRGSGIFGNSSLNGIYDFDESILDYDGLSIWSSFGGFLDEQENEGELENNIREFFLGKLQAYLDENGNVVIDKKDLGALNALSMATLLQTDVGQQLKDEFENEYKDKISSMLFGEGTNEAGMMPFGTSSTEEELMKSVAPLVTLLTSLGVGNKVASDKGSNGDSNEDKENESKSLIGSLNQAIMDHPELFKSSEKLEVFGEFVSQLGDMDDSEFTNLADAAGFDLSELAEEMLRPKKSLLSPDHRAEISSGSDDAGSGVKFGHSLGAEMAMGKYEGSLNGLITGGRAEMLKEYLEENGIDLENMSADEQMQLMDDFTRDSSTHSKMFQKELAEIVKESKYGEAESTALGSLAGSAAAKFFEDRNSLIERVEHEETDEASDFNLDTDGDAKVNLNSTNISKHKNTYENASQNNIDQGVSKVPSGGGGHGHKGPIHVAVDMQQQPVKVPEVVKDIVKEKVQITEEAIPKIDKKPSVGSDLPKVPQIKTPSDSTIGGSVETKIDLPEISKEEIKSSSAVVGAAGLGASAIISGSGGSVPSVPSVPAGGIVTPSAPTVSVDMDFAAPAPNVSAPGAIQSGTVVNNATTVNAANSSATANSAGNVGINNAINPQTGNNASQNPNANASAKSTITTHATESSSSKSEVLGKGKSSYGAPSDAQSGKSTNKAQSSEARVDAEQQEQKTKVEDLDKQVNANAPEGVLGDSSYAELILKNEKEVKIATGITVSSLAFTLALKLTNIIGIVSFVLVLLAIVLVYTTFRIKKGKERKKLESLIIIEKIKKEEELATKDATEETVVEEVSEENETEEVTNEIVVEDGNEVEEVPTEVEETVENNNEETEENVVYEEEIVYVDEDGNVIELPEGAEVVYEEVVEEVVEPEVEIPEKKEFQSAEEVIYGEMPKKASEEE